MLRPAALGVLVVAVALVTAACSGSSDPAPTTTTVPVTTVAPTTAAPTTTQPAKATRGAATSADAVAQLVDAWNRRDRAAAAQIADRAAVDGIFAAPGDAMSRRGCTPDDSLPEGGCIYWVGNGLIQFNTEHRPVGWVVVSAQYGTIDDGNETSGNAPDAPPPTTVPPTTAAPTTVS